MYSSKSASVSLFASLRDMPCHTGTTGSVRSAAGADTIRIAGSAGSVSIADTMIQGDDLALIAQALNALRRLSDTTLQNHHTFKSVKCSAFADSGAPHCIGRAIC